MKTIVMFAPVAVELEEGLTTSAAGDGLWQSWFSA